MLSADSDVGHIDEARSAATIAAASRSPSITRCGRLRSSQRSLTEAGSPSSPFAIDDGAARGAAVIANRAQLHRKGKGGPAAAEQSAGFDFAQQFVGAGERLVATQLSICGQVLAPAGLLTQHPGLRPQVRWRW